MKLLKAFFRRITNDLKQKKLLPLKILFFVHASTFFVLYPYLTIHMRELGINVEETAIMSAVTPVVAIIMPPLAGMVADKIGNFKLLFAISTGMGGAAALLLLMVPVGRVTVTFPGRAELAVGCPASDGPAPAPALTLDAARFPCEQLHPYSYHVEMRVETCGFVCEWLPENGSLPLSDAISYAVKIRNPAQGSTEVFRYPLTKADIPNISSMADQNSVRLLVNNERYKTALKRVSDSSLFFPTIGMYNFVCDKPYENSTDLFCEFGSNDTTVTGEKSSSVYPTYFMAKVKPSSEKSTDRVLPMSPSSQPESIKQFNIESLAGLTKTGENMTKKQINDLDFSSTTCFDYFAGLEDEVSMEILLRSHSHESGSPSRVGVTVGLGGCVPRCIATTPREALCANPKQEVELDITLTFWSYLAVRVFTGIIGGTAYAMFEGAVIAILREHGADYGLQRIYGSIGGMISSPLSGMLIDYFSRGKGYTDFRPAFYLYVVLKVLSAALVLTVNLEFKSPASNLMEDVFTVLRNVEIVALFVACFVLGTAFGYIEAFLFWLLQDLGGSRSLMGITITVGGIAGIPLLVMSGPIIERIGHANVLFIGFIFYAIRLLGYSLIYNPWMCLIFEALESVTSSLAFTAAVTYAARLSTTTTDTSIQGLLGGLYFGVGKGAGSLIGGYLIKYFGTRPTYRIFATATLITGIMYFLFNRFYVVKRPQREGNDICKKKPKTKDVESCAKTDVALTNGGSEKMPLKESKNNVSMYLESAPPKGSANINQAYESSEKGIDRISAILDPSQPVHPKAGVGNAGDFHNEAFDGEETSGVRDRKRLATDAEVEQVDGAPANKLHGNGRVVDDK